MGISAKPSSLGPPRATAAFRRAARPLTARQARLILPGAFAASPGLRHAAKMEEGIMVEAVWPRVGSCGGKKPFFPAAAYLVFLMSRTR
jgi:hypothetical protein